MNYGSRVLMGVLLTTAKNAHYFILKFKIRKLGVLGFWGFRVLGFKVWGFWELGDGFLDFAAHL